MRRFSIFCLTIAGVMAPGVQAGSLDNVVEPAMVMKLDFGGSQRSEFNMGLRLNYSTSVRQALSALSANPETPVEALETGIGSSLFSGPALTQLDFNRNGFRKAYLLGLPLVTRHVRLNQTEEETAAEEAPAEEGAEVPAEDAVWYDYEQWGWMGWGLAAAGAVGVYLLVDDDDSKPAASGGGGGGGGGDECGPDEVPNPLPVGPPCVPAP